MSATSRLNLEGFRESLLAPREIVRDEDGYLVHPALPICDEGTDYSKLLGAFGLETDFVAMEFDADESLFDRYGDGDNKACAEWTPTPPAGDGWLLIEIYDTENGPYALFIRDTEKRNRCAHKSPARHSAIADIAAERIRQIGVEGWTPEHDDEHNTGELAAAAAAYALDAAHAVGRPPVDPLAHNSPPSFWPWWKHAHSDDVSATFNADGWKPNEPRRNLVRAGALIVAEIERLERAQLIKRVKVLAGKPARVRTLLKMPAGVKSVEVEVVR